MANILIITAHPSKYGFVHKIAKKYKETKRKFGDEVEVLDLYKKINRQDFLKFEDVRKMEKDPSVERMQKKISWADELAFVFPMWWCGEPAILKNFWDKNFTARYAYRYIDGKPTGLLNGRSARIFLTCDGKKLYYFLMLNPLRSIWWLTRLRFCGIRLKSFTIFDIMFQRNDNSKKELLLKVVKIAQKK